MNKKLPVIWSPVAEQTYTDIILYLASEWSLNTAKKFDAKTDKLIDTSARARLQRVRNNLQAHSDIQTVLNYYHAAGHLPHRLHTARERWVSVIKLTALFNSDFASLRTSSNRPARSSEYPYAKLLINEPKANLLIVITTYCLSK